MHTPLAIAILLSIAALAWASNEYEIVPEFYVRIAHKGDIGSSLEKLDRIGVMFDHARLKEPSVDAYVTEEHLIELEKLGYQVERLVSPGEEYLRRRTVSEDFYHHYDNLTTFLQTMETNYPGIAKRVVIGTSTLGRSIQGLRITKNPDVRENEPEVKYIANIHGDEVIGREITIYFIDLLLSQYNLQPSTSLSERITRLIDNTDIYVIPSMNPDGFESARRSNSRGRDLNRNFPDLRFPGRETGLPEAESTAVMNFIKDHHFVLSISFHGGSVVANYPYDGNQAYRSGVVEKTPDDDVFRHISLVYSEAHTTMHLSREFHNGITNGAEWYVLYGGMQDWNYVGRGCLEVTMEVSDVKYPPAGQLAAFWGQNKLAMLVYLEQVHTGVKGVVLDSQNHSPIAATIVVTGRDGIAVTADPTFGNYYRLLRPGVYTLTASADGYQSQSLEVEVPEGQQVYETVTLDFSLSKL